MTITIENLSKKYLIRDSRKIVTETLKDRLTQGLNGLFNREKRHSQHVEIQEFWALKDLSFTVHQGDCLAILGENGAGKSTLLKIISRITPPTSGRLKIKGTVASLLEVGTGFHPELTGRENIYLNGALLGMSKQEIKNNFDKIVAFSEIETFLDTPVKRYSSGMFVRLGFAVAAHLNPNILIVDEALAVGNATFKKKCLKKMEQVGSEGRTIIFVTHDMWALRFCNKGLLLNKGSIVPTKDLNDCISKYAGTTLLEKQEKIWKGHFKEGPLVIHQFAFDDKVSGKPVIQVKMTILESVIDLCVGFYICNQYGNKILHHMINHEEGILISLKPGTYEFSTEMDLKIFSEGKYKVILDTGFHNHKKNYHPNISLFFKVYKPNKLQGEPRETILTGWKGSCRSI